MSELITLMKQTVQPYWMPEPYKWLAKQHVTKSLAEDGRVGLVNMLWLVVDWHEHEDHIVSAKACATLLTSHPTSKFILYEAPKLRINGKSFEAMAAMSTLKDFVANLHFSGLPEHIVVLKKYASRRLIDVNA